MKKIYFIGGTSEFSSKIVDDLRNKFSFEVVAVGRRTGHDIPANLNKIKQEALSNDIIVNFTYAGGQQLNVLFDFYKEISKNEWNGYFINIGSSIVLHGKSSMDKVNELYQSIKYHSQKKAIQEAGHFISRNFMSNGFKFTQVQCGMLANKKMQNLSSYRDTCLHASDISSLINYLINLPSNIHMHEVILDGK